MSAALLAVADLSLAYGRVPALQHVSLSVARGESLVIVGESGSGKSSLGLAVMRLLPPTARLLGGSIRFLGPRGASVELTTADAAQLQHLRGKEIGMIFQEPMTSLNPVIRIGDQIVEALRFHETLPRSRARERAVALLTHLGVPEAVRRMEAFPHELSGGLRQRVMIAIALVCNPSLLIADEPTTALDVTVQAGILRLLERLRRENDLAVILITHDLGVMSAIADRISIFYAGRVVESGVREDVLQRPRHPYTRSLLDALPH
ncbi:MAG: ABC transporter ATP-binding protein, partial [Acetobacteraceae bacterium]